MFIDSHCHLDKLDLTPYDNNFSAMLQACRERQVNEMLCVSISDAEFPAMYELIRDQEGVHASVGIHPLSAGEKLLSIEELVELSAKDKIVALGETGLDFYYQQDTIEQQRLSFENHLKAAGQVALPVIVHTRDAREETLSMIRQHGDLDAGGVLHCFTESLEMAQAAIELNYMISFSGIITFRNAAELRDVVKNTPLDRILIETDSPYLAPVPHRGKKNEPRYVVEVAQCVADLKGISLEEVAGITRENFYRLFNRADKR
mgnify:CR=1 FL=1